MAIKKVFYRSPHNYDLDEASDQASVVNDLPSMTVQAEAEDVDINVLIKRFGVGYNMPQGIQPIGYGDFTDVVDYRSALHAVMDARERFGAMPAEVRARFLNDPQTFLEFATNPANLPELRRLGLAIPEKVDESRANVGPVNQTPGDQRAAPGTGAVRDQGAASGRPQGPDGRPADGSGGQGAGAGAR